MEAFGGDPAALVALEGGQGHAWRAGAIVLKPRVHDEPVEHLATVAAIAAAATDEVRVASPVRARDGAWEVEGWWANVWLEGEPDRSRPHDILRVSEVFHAAVAHAPPPRVGATPWDVADRMAWGEERVDAALVGDAAGWRELLDEPWTGAPSQLIHGDIAGNVVFADDLGLPPGVIDLSPQWRPAAYAQAIAVADLVAWWHAPLDVAHRFVADHAQGASLLARALVFRLCAAAILCEGEPDRVARERAAFTPLADLLARQ